MSKKTIIETIEKKEKQFIRIATEIWEKPELSHYEEDSSALQKSFLREEGFKITELDGTQPYAFIAEIGEGLPVIGLLGEFDALPGLSQKVSTEQDPFVPGGPGHGCGHNLLGTACLAAAVGLKAAIDKKLLKGTVKYFGCPAEEQLGKPVLARAGVFSGLDAVLCWHPADINTVAAYSTNASVELTFSFKGAPAHAAQVPHLGRSALDALTLMNVGVEFLREHMPSSARVHYVVTSGGDRANIVPAYASGSFQIRSRSMKEVVPLLGRVIDVARGAALMTGTAVEWKLLHGCHDVLPNSAMSDLLHENLLSIPLPVYSKEENQFSHALSATLSADQKKNTLLGLGLDVESAESLLSSPIHAGVGYWGKGWTIPASTDVGDVSHIAPTAQINTATYPMGIGSHTWQATSSSGSSVGMKGMLYAAKVLGASAFDLMTRPDVLKTAQEEFRKATSGEKYMAAAELIDGLN